MTDDAADTSTTVPREDYEALEASLRLAEAYAVEQAVRIQELEAQLGLIQRRVLELTERMEASSDA